MDITEVRLHRMTPGTKIKTVASVTLDDEFVVHDVKVVVGARGLFVAMASRELSKGRFYDVAHPVTAACRLRIERSVLARFEEVPRR